MLDRSDGRHKSQGHYKLLWERATDMMLWLDRDYRIVEANAAAGEAFDLTPKEMLGLDIKALCAPESVTDFFQALEHARVDGRAAIKTTQVFQDGKKFAADVVISSIELDGDLATLVVLRDVTERKRAEEAIADAYEKEVESSRLKSEFVATMSHEIRTPINAVLGMNELLLDTTLSQEQRDYAETVRDSSLSLLGIIDDVLDFSKIEVGKLELEHVDMNLTDALESAATSLAAVAQRKGISLMTYVGPEVPSVVRGDPVRLRQILVNLIGNAVKFTNQGGILASVESNSETVTSAQLRFNVKDSGIGFGPAAAAKIFEPFRQADGSTTRKYGGTGLGLTISRRLAELMGGTLSVKSALGVGSEFSFSVAFARSKNEVRQQPVQSKGLRVIIVGGEQSAQDSLHQYMVDWKISAVCTSSATDALDKMREQVALHAPFDVAIVDYNTPAFAALDIGRAIRADPLLRDVRLVFLTSYGGQHRGEMEQIGGSSYYLRKPVRRGPLFDCVVNPEHAQVNLRLRPPGGRSDRPATGNGTVTGRLERILVVEDQPVNQRLVLQQLKKLGFSAVAVANGQEAIDAVAGAAYDLVFMDCQMPVVDGFAATRTIRAVEFDTGRHVTIVAMTANARREDRANCLAAGMDDYVAKPVMIDHLRSTLASWLPQAAVAV